MAMKKINAKKTKKTPLDAMSTVEEARKELLKLRFRRAIGEGVSGTRFRALRKMVARSLTAINSKRT
jgi:ribosomal protein L29